MYLYDNPDLSGGRTLDPDLILTLRDRLAGIKISAPAATVAPWLGHLPVWVGYPDVWFALAAAPVRPDGVVMGMANALPSQWAGALRNDTSKMRQLFGAYTAATTFGGRRHTIACAKAALVSLGVIDRGDVLPGTPALSAAQSAQFASHFRSLLTGAP